MTYLQGLKDFASGLTRGLSLYFCERNDFVLKTSLPGVTDKQQR